MSLRHPRTALLALTLALSVFAILPTFASAALYAPGATLDPACAPNDANCGVATSSSASIGTGTVGQVPYYAANGTALTATSSITILQNGFVGIGTTSPFTLLSVAGSGAFTGGLLVGNATGGMPASGIINAQGLQINGVGVGPFLPAGIDTVTVVNAGTGYVPSTPPNTADVITLAGGTSTTNGVVYVTSTKVVSATVAVGGSSCTNGTQTVTGTTGGDGWNVGSSNVAGNFVPAQKFQASVTVSGGAITAVNSITVAGIYFLNPTAVASELVTGAGCSGARLSLGMGALTAAVQNPGLYTAIPGTTATLTQGSNTGSGTGATFIVTYKSIPQNTGNGSLGGPFNTIFGYNAGAANVGDSNVFMGWEAGAQNTIGKDNIFIGPQAGYAYTGAGNVWPDTGQNVYIGSLAGQSSTNGIANVLVGQKAGTGLTTGSNLVCIGTHSCTSLTTAGQSVWIGQAAGNNATSTGNFNVSVGSSAGQFLTGTAASNVFIGYGAGSGVSTAVSNSGSSNVVVGSIAGAVLTTATQSAFLGAQAGNAVTTGAGNTLIGYQAGFRTINGGNNVFIGNDAGVNNTTGSRNIYIGANAGLTAPPTIQNLFVAGASNNERIDNVFFGKGYVDTAATAYTINGTGGFGTNSIGGDINFAGGIGVGNGKGGDLIFKTAPTGSSGTATSTLAEVMRITNSALVGIGTSSPYAQFSVFVTPATLNTTVFAIGSSTAAFATTTLFAISNRGDVTINGSGGSTCTIGNGVGGTSCTSDQRLKTNILVIPNALEGIQQLRGVTFNWADTNKDQSQFIGVIAQDVQRIYPQAVSTTGDGFLSVDYSSLVAPLIEAVKELANKVAALTNTVAGFATKITTKQLCVEKSDGTAVCVNGDQLSNILNGSQTTTVQVSEPTPPVIDDGTDDSASSTEPTDTTDETPAEDAAN